MPTPAALRTRRVIAAILLPLVLAAAVGMALTWPHGDPVTARTVSAVDVDYPTATVTGSTQERCEGTVEDRQTDGTIPADVPCLRVAATVTSGPMQGEDIEVWATASTTADDVPAGTRILVEHYPATDSDAEIWAWHDFDRTLPLVTIALVFALAIILVARTRGLRALVGLVIAFAVIGAYVLPALLAGENPVVVALSASTLIMVVVLYLAHGLSLRTSAALLGTLAGLAATTLLGVLGAEWARLSGVSSEDSYRLSQLLGENGATSLRGLFLCGLVLAGLGVLNDVTITQASAVWELRAVSPGATRRELFRGGMRIGRDHIASTVYTIAFAYTGAALPVLLLLELYQLPLGPTLTSGEFAEEIVRTMVSSIGLVLAIPLTTGIAALVVTRAGAAPARHAEADGHGHAHVHVVSGPDTDAAHDHPGPHEPHSPHAAHAADDAPR